ncbi:hypothetical protein, partial [Achromobacter sp. DMS1]|uniref:hypothetical protein n=1 Tax=Achromobacter sp. DMS1 TaxID=1688405 RepID=UPI000B0BB3FC
MTSSSACARGLAARSGTAGTGRDRSMGGGLGGRLRGGIVGQAEGAQAGIHSHAGAPDGAFVVIAR